MSIFTLTLIGGNGRNYSTTIDPSKSSTTLVTHSSRDGLSAPFRAATLKYVNLPATMLGAPPITFISHIIVMYMSNLSAAVRAKYSSRLCANKMHLYNNGPVQEIAIFFRDSQCVRNERMMAKIISEDEGVGLLKMVKNVESHSTRKCAH